MTITSVMLDDDGVLRSGYLLVLAETAAQALLAAAWAPAHRNVVDVVLPQRAAGAVLLAESVLRSHGDHQLVCDTTIYSETTRRSVVATVRHHIAIG